VIDEVKFFYQEIFCSPLWIFIGMLAAVLVLFGGITWLNRYAAAKLRSRLKRLPPDVPESSAA